MPEMIKTEFDRLDEAIRPSIRLAGLDHAYATVRRRRTVRLTIASALTLTLLAGLGTFYAARDVDTAPPVTTTPTTSGAPPMAIRSLVDDAASPLHDSTVVLPSFGHDYCPQGTTRFVDDAWTGPGVPEVFDAEAWVTQVVTGAVRAAGSSERAVLFTCNAGTDPGAYAAQVAVYRADSLTLVGQVIQVSGGLSKLRGVEIAPDRTVRVLVAQTPGAGPTTELAWQVFRWTGTRFEQTDSVPVAIDARPTQLTVTATNVDLSDRGGSTTIRVTNRGGPQLEAVILQLVSSVPLVIGPTDRVVCRAACPPRPIVPDAGAEVYSLIIEPVQPGMTVEGSFTITVPEGSVPDRATLTVQVFGTRVGDDGMVNDDDSNVVTAVIAKES